MCLVDMLLNTGDQHAELTGVQQEIAASALIHLGTSRARRADNKKDAKAAHVHVSGQQNGRPYFCSASSDQRNRLAWGHRLIDRETHRENYN